MRRLCTESPCPYSGRSVRRCAVMLGRPYTSRTTGSPSPGVPWSCRAVRAKQAAGRTTHSARRRVIADVIEQKSAEAIVARVFGKRRR